MRSGQFFLKDLLENSRIYYKVFSYHAKISFQFVVRIRVSGLPA